MFCSPNPLKELAGYRNVQNFPSPISGHPGKATCSFSHLLPLKYYFSLFQLSGAGRIPDILSRLVISKPHKSHGCRWDFPKHLAYSGCSTTPTKLIIKASLCDASEADGKHCLVITKLKKFILMKALFLFFNFFLLIMRREEMRLLLSLNAFN